MTASIYRVKYYSVVNQICYVKDCGWKISVQPQSLRRKLLNHDLLSNELTSSSGWQSLSIVARNMDWTWMDIRKVYFIAGNEFSYSLSIGKLKDLVRC